jgi:hypothetical protein
MAHSLSNIWRNLSKWLAWLKPLYFKFLYYYSLPCVVAIGKPQTCSNHDGRTFLKADVSDSSWRVGLHLRDEPQSDDLAVRAARNDALITKIKHRAKLFKRV